MEKKKKLKVKIDINPYMFDMMVKCFFTSNFSASIRLISSIYKLMDILDVDEKNKEVYFKTILLKKLCSLFVNNKFNDKRLLYCEVTDGDSLVIAKYKEYIDSLGGYEAKLSDEEINHLETYISTRLQYSHLFSRMDKFEDLTTRFKMNDYDSLMDFVAEFQETIKDTHLYLSALKPKNRIEKFDFSTDNPESLTNIVNELVLEESGGRRKIKTGVRILNSFLGGGYEPKTVTCAMGIPGKWKSGFLLFSAINAVKYNKDYICKDPTKTPTVVYISMENHQLKTLKRMYSYIKGNNFKHEFYNKSKSIPELVSIINEELNSPIKLDILYRENDTISCNDVDEMIEDFSLRGKEVIMVVIDYIGRMKANLNIYNTPDLRIKYGAISDDMCELSKARNIPILTAGQINREGEKKIDAMVEKNKAGQVNAIGRGDTSESRKLLENVDRAFAVHMEKMEDGKWVLGIKDLKHRDDMDTLLEQFYIRFEETSTMRLVEDLNSTEEMHLTEIKGSELTAIANKIKPEEVASSIGASLNELF